MRMCKVCFTEKLMTDFSRKGNSFQHQCKECFKEYHRRYYENNREKYFAKNRRNKNRQRERLKKIAETFKHNPCLDCGGNFHPWVMEFDHREGTEKIEAVGNLLARGCTEDVLLKEIEKCDIVCANCHRMRTYERLQKMKLNKTNPKESLDFELSNL